MNRTRKTIFDLERRINLAEEYEDIYADISDNMGYVFDSIKTWPYRQATKDVWTYGETHGFSLNRMDSDEEMLYSLELILNLLHWAPIYKNKLSGLAAIAFDEGLNTHDECKIHIENIEYILEGINMQVREINGTEATMYTIRKRDVDVDAVLETVPELSETLLSYLDIRNQKDEAAKKAILKSIADFLEPLRKSKYKGTAYSQLCEDIFTVFNKCAIRHNNKDQWSLKKAERMKLYDQTFKAAVHLLQSSEADQFKDTVAELKQRFDNKQKTNQPTKGD